MDVGLSQGTQEPETGMEESQSQNHQVKQQSMGKPQADFCFLI